MWGRTADEPCLRVTDPPAPAGHRRVCAGRTGDPPRRLSWVPIGAHGLRYAWARGWFLTIRLKRLHLHPRK